MKFVVIGISDSLDPFFSLEVLKIIKGGRVFSGGRRHHRIVASLLPVDSTWIDITVPLDAVLRQYVELSVDTGEHGIIVFASGDPLFFGFANTLQREFPDAELKVYPTFNSLQMLAHRMCLPYHDMHVVSLTGRPWDKLDSALISGYSLIGCLTDKEKTPHAIHERMHEYGYDNYLMTVGENLGNDTVERITRYHPEMDYANPNCVILQQTEKRSVPFGIPDQAFALLGGRSKMITKMPIRLLTLQALDLPRHHVFWDIGACTGSVSIEARLLFPHLRVVAFEIRPECEEIIKENIRRHGAPGIEVVVGDFGGLCSDRIATNGTPDALFIGGHGGRLKQILAKALEFLAPGGVIVMNSVTSSVVESLTDHRPCSRQLWDEACAELGLAQSAPLHIQLNDYNPIEILKATKL